MIFTSFRFIFLGLLGIKVKKWLNFHILQSNKAKKTAKKIDKSLTQTIIAQITKKINSFCAK